MSLAADAISDIVALPVRSGDAPARDDGGPSFAEHLDAAAPRERERPEHRSETREPRTDSEPSEKSPAETAAVTAPAEATQQSAQPRPVRASAERAPALMILANLVAQTATPTENAEAPIRDGARPASQQVPPTAIQTSVAAAPVQPKPVKAQTKAAHGAKPAAQAKTTAPTQPASSPEATAQHAPTPDETPKVASAHEASAEAPKQDQAVITPQAVPIAAPQAPDVTPARPQQQRDIAIDANAGGAPKTPTLAPQPKTPDLDTDAKPKASASKIAAPQAQSAPSRDAASPAPRIDAALPPQPAAPAQASQRTEAAPDANLAARAGAPVAQQIGHEIIRRSHDGATRFEMRLDPPELGRVDIKLEVSRDHRVTAIIAADNPQALTELSRGARDLQQALSAAGLDLPDDGLSFDLSGQQGAFAQQDMSEPRQQGARNDTVAPQHIVEDATPAPVRPLALERWRGGRVDVMA